MHCLFFSLSRTQHKLFQKSDWVSKHLPPDAPLSTFRVITCSRASIDSTTTNPVVALSCVFRAGRAGAATDHDSILFDVDVQTGTIRGGTTNAHWYKLGLQALWTCPWRSSHSYETHPDGDIPVAGATVPDISGMLRLVEQSHYKMCPRVPFAGWDVVLSADPALPVCLLEVNLSCNFFRGSFDKKVRFIMMFVSIFFDFDHHVVVSRSFLIYRYISTLSMTRSLNYRS